jgi:hypothetical protein
VIFSEEILILVDVDADADKYLLMVDLTIDYSIAPVINANLPIVFSTHQLKTMIPRLIPWPADARTRVANTFLVHFFDFLWVAEVPFSIASRVRGHSNNT